MLTGIPEEPIINRKKYMPVPKTKCVIILSSKSSGSSACQNLLARFADIKYVSKTRHFENETLYWTKAASILGLPQQKMIDSEVPISSEKARKDLIELLGNNLENYTPPYNDVELIFGGWRKLCKRFSPIFLEKSPHHLFQWSALELILRCMEMMKDVDFLFIGLVRNPMDTIYSAFRRWGTLPEKLQYEWLTAYQNLRKLSGLVGDKMIIVRYEDMVSSLGCMDRIFSFCNVDMNDADFNYLHTGSIAKWKQDKLYGFALSDEVVSLAETYGYKKEDLINGSNILWPAYRNLLSIVKKMK